MADPTIQTFCCHRPNRSDSHVNVLMEFHSDLYSKVCVVSSVLGIVGAIYQVWPFRATSLIAEGTTNTRRLKTFLVISDRKPN
jgi:ocular albinism type 1 protein